jgi:hypothetical protein
MGDQTPQAVQACHELIGWLIPQLDKFPRLNQVSVRMAAIRCIRDLPHENSWLRLDASSHRSPRTTCLPFVGLPVSRWGCVGCQADWRLERV